MKDASELPETTEGAEAQLRALPDIVLKRRREFLAEVGGDPEDIRGILASVDFLPVTLDMGGCAGISPAGDVVSVTWEEPHRVTAETDPKVRNMVLYRAGLEYPELRWLAPVRPSDAGDCGTCGGTGQFPGVAGSGVEGIVCECGGLGWLPPGIGDIGEQLLPSRT